MALALAGCDARERIEHKVWNLFAINAALGEGRSVAAGPTLPDGIPASDLLTPNSSGAVTLKVQRAFAEGKPAAFVTTELWTNYDDGIWLQPIYAQFIAADLTARIDTPLLIDVGPESTFYSPFWQVNYAVVGDVPGYSSTKDLLDAASQIIPAGMKTCPLRPLDMAADLALPGLWDPWNASISLQTVPPGEVVYEEEETVETVGVFDFGHELFELQVGDHGTVVKASPMFLFVDSNGTPLTGEPRVLSAGEVALDPASGRPQPRYGGLWRVVKAMLPGSAGAFHGDAHSAARDAAMRANGDPLDYEGRIAIDRACFEDAAASDFPDGCAWLDSQARLESLLGAGRLVATEITQTGPIVLYDKQPVPVNQ